MRNGKNLLVAALVFLGSASFCEGGPKIDTVGNASKLVEYQYRYSVDESESRGPVMDRWEQRIGEYVKGAYSVLEPDGRIRTVDYEVDGGKGYHAVIRTDFPGKDFVPATMPSATQFPIRESSAGEGTLRLRPDRRTPACGKEPPPPTVRSSGHGGGPSASGIVPIRADGVERSSRKYPFAFQGSELLSYRQLAKSAELFPAATLPAVTFDNRPTTRNARNDGNFWENYHSRSPYVNEVTSERGMQVRGPQKTTPSAAAPGLPLSPANYNVPRTTKLIRFSEPAALIPWKISTVRGTPDKREFKRSSQRENIGSNQTTSRGKDADQRRKRNSRLVKRFKSIGDAKN